MNTRLLMALRLAQNRNSYDSGRIHKACSTDSRTERSCDGISDKDHREHYRTDGSEKEGNWRYVE